MKENIMKSKTEFMVAVFEMFPEARELGVITNAQCAEFLKKTDIRIYKIRDLDNMVAKGTFKIKAEYMGVDVEKTPVLMKKKEVVVNLQGIVPSKLDYYVPFGVYNDILDIVQSKQFFPAYITGPTSNGKSTAVQQACNRAGRGFIRVNINQQTDEEMLIGSKTLVDGNVQIVDGPVVIAARTGSVILIDEIDCGNANTLMLLQSILEGGSFYFKLKDEWITPAPGFNIIATANTKGKGSELDDYVGTNILNEAFLERFAVTLEQEYPTKAIELKILNKYAEEISINNDKFITDLSEWSDVIKKSHMAGAVDDLITTRRLIHILGAYKLWKDEKKAVSVCLNRFSHVTKEAFVDLFEKLSIGAVEADNDSLNQEEKV